MSFELVHGNALALPFDDESVDLIITSPPYWSLRTYQDGGEAMMSQIGAEASPTEFISTLIRCTAEMKRVLKPTGSMFVNLGDKYAGSGGHNNAGIGGEGRGPSNYPKSGAPFKSLIGIPWRYAIRCIDDLSLLLRAEIIWSKVNSMPDSALDRVRRTHEHWFHFTKEAQYFSSIDNIRIPYAPSPKTDGQQNDGKGKTPGSVWPMTMEPLRVPKELGTDHYAAFPSEWPRQFILGWSTPGAVVLDPFGGTGTTAAVAHFLGRHGVSLDLSHEYQKIAEWRCTDERFRKKVLSRTPVQDWLISQAENASS